MIVEKRTTTKVLCLIDKGRYNKIMLAKELGISRPALNKKILGTTEWKKLEIYWIDKLYNAK